MLFITPFLNATDFDVLQMECRGMRGAMKREKDSLAVGRVGCYVPTPSTTHTLLTADHIAQRIARAVGFTMQPSTYPMELRSYRVGAGMDWHQDDPLYEEPQCELVLCLHNSSDARTEWFDAKKERHTVWTPPNTALLIRAGSSGALHRVIPPKTGERTILKMVWTVPDSSPLPTFAAHIDSLPGLRGKGRRRAHHSRRSR